jgi:hypothetical protein
LSSTGTLDREFHRILKPGGLVVITSRKRDFLENLKNPPYPENLNVSQGYADYDSGKHVYFGTGGGLTQRRFLRGGLHLQKICRKGMEQLLYPGGFYRRSAVYRPECDCPGEKTGLTRLINRNLCLTGKLGHCRL